MSLPIVRLARACGDLEAIAGQYREGLALVELARFMGHEGFDGVVLGEPNGAWHLEFLYVHGDVAPPPPHPEHAVVLYVPERQAWQARVAAMEQAGFLRVTAPNPYWERVGRSYADHEGGRVIVQQAAWQG